MLPCRLKLLAAFWLPVVRLAAPLYLNTLSLLASTIQISVPLVVMPWTSALPANEPAIHDPSGTPLALKIFIAPIEFVSFLVRPFSLGLRPFVAMFAGHILLEVFGNFVVQGLNAGGPLGYAISALCFVFVVAVSALELLVGAIQAFVFALLTSLYIKDAVHLH